MNNNKVVLKKGRTNMRYLTKSKFKLALECITKLYYKNKPEYADTNIDDPFLQALAEGGFQVGELAKFYFCNDPIRKNITINTLDYSLSMGETKKRLEKKNVTIAEAAFSYDNLFVRIDILEKKGSNISIYEVKSKSIDGDNEQFLNKKGEIKSKWEPYLYDIAFQKYVVEKSLGEKVKSHLILIDKTRVSSIAGLNQKFKIIKNPDGTTSVKTAADLKRVDLGDPILKNINTDEIVEKIWSSSVLNTEIRFEEFVELCADIYENQIQKFVIPSKGCKSCQFVNTSSSLKDLKSGFMECWKSATNYNAKLLKKDLVVELWGGRAGSRSLVQELIDHDIFLLKDAKEVIIKPSNEHIAEKGLSPHQRRMEQINRVKIEDDTNYFDSKGFLSEMEEWKYPLHMIDFETSMTALPFHKGRHPYEGIAFQFSHHIMEQDGDVYHAGQFISFESGVFPNYNFVRELKQQLEKDEGSIFRYHMHENTYLNLIHNQLETDPEPPEDKDELIEFVSTITTRHNGKEKTVGNRNMIDLYEVILRYYYSPYAKGNNSIKKILPALIHESDFLKQKYGKPEYGINKKIKSLNFQEHVWIDPNFENDPYKTLPRLFEEYDPEVLDELFANFDEVSDGGSAMTAYNYLQFSEIPEDQRLSLIDGLLRYCELDTLAMVMIVEGLKDKAK